MYKMANIEVAEKVGRFKKSVKDMWELPYLLSYLARIIAKCQHLADDRGKLETVVGEKIMDEDMKRWFFER